MRRLNFISSEIGRPPRLHSFETVSSAGEAATCSCPKVRQSCRVLLLGISVICKSRLWQIQVEPSILFCSETKSLLSPSLWTSASQTAHAELCLFSVAIHNLRNTNPHVLKSFRCPESLSVLFQQQRLPAKYHNYDPAGSRIQIGCTFMSETFIKRCIRYKILLQLATRIYHSSCGEQIGGIENEDFESNCRRTEILCRASRLSFEVTYLVNVDMMQRAASHLRNEHRSLQLCLCNLRFSDGG
jgi:hypothetical protein